MIFYFIIFIVSASASMVRVFRVSSINYRILSSHLRSNLYAVVVVVGKVNRLPLSTLVMYR